MRRTACEDFRALGNHSTKQELYQKEVLDARTPHLICKGFGPLPGIAVLVQNKISTVFQRFDNLQKLPKLDDDRNHSELNGLNPYGNL